MDFDSKRHERHQERENALGDRSFTFGGHTMTYRANAPYNVTKKVAAITENTDGAEVFEALENAVLGLLTKESRDLFRQACDNDDDPVTFEDLIELSNWLIERQVQRPPTPPVSSAGLSATNGTASTAISSTEPAAV
jgi:hypothetical protein